MQYRPELRRPEVGMAITQAGCGGLGRRVGAKTCSPGVSIYSIRDAAARSKHHMHARQSRHVSAGLWFALAQQDRNVLVVLSSPSLKLKWKTTASHNAIPHHLPLQMEPLMCINELLLGSVWFISAQADKTSGPHQVGSPFT